MTDEQLKNALDKSREGEGKDNRETEKLLEEAAGSKSTLLDADRQDAIEKRQRASVSSAESMTSRMFGRPAGLEDLGVQGVDLVMKAADAVGRLGDQATKALTDISVASEMKLQDGSTAKSMDDSDWWRDLQGGSRHTEVEKQILLAVSGNTRLNQDRVSEELKNVENEDVQKYLADRIEANGGKPLTAGQLLETLKNTSDPKEAALILSALRQYEQIANSHDDEWFGDDEITADDVRDWNQHH